MNQKHNTVKDTTKYGISYLDSKPVLFLRASIDTPTGYALFSQNLFQK